MHPVDHVCSSFSFGDKRAFRRPAGRFGQETLPSRRLSEARGLGGAAGARWRR